MVNESTTHLIHVHVPQATTSTFVSPFDYLPQCIATYSPKQEPPRSSSSWRSVFLNATFLCKRCVTNSSFRYAITPWLWVHVPAWNSHSAVWTTLLACVVATTYCQMYRATFTYPNRNRLVQAVHQGACLRVTRTKSTRAVSRIRPLMAAMSATHHRTKQHASVCCPLVMLVLLIASVTQQRLSVK